MALVLCMADYCASLTDGFKAQRQSNNPSIMRTWQTFHVYQMIHRKRRELVFCEELFFFSPYIQYTESLVPRAGS